MRKDENNALIVPTAGHYKTLRCHLRSSCGKIEDGVSFAFDGEGSWLIAFDTLKEIVALGESVRSNNKDQVRDE